MNGARRLKKYYKQFDDRAAISACNPKNGNQFSEKHALGLDRPVMLQAYMQRRSER
jgi:uncharacterized protein (DUF302 family)